MRECRFFNPIPVATYGRRRIKPENEHGTHATLKDENSIEPTTCPKTSVLNFIDDPSCRISACLQIDFIRGDDFHHEWDRLLVFAVYG